MNRREWARRLLGAGALAGVARGQGPVPRPSPEFTFALADGKKVSLGQYRGKVVALTFLSSTCSHCQKLTQILNGIQSQFGPRGAQVLAAIFNENASSLLPAYLRQYEPTYPLGHSSSSAVYGYLQLSFMRNFFVPMMAFVDRGGVIRAQYTGNDSFFRSNEDANVREMLESLLKEPGGKSSSAKKS